MTDIHIRAIPTQLETEVGKTVDGQRQITLTGRLVPYNVVADVLDIDQATGERDLYREGFRPGAFSHQLNQADKKAMLGRLSLRHRHGDDGLGYLGPFIALREADDGLYGDVAVLPTKRDDVQTLLRAGVDELSVEFRMRRVDDHTETADDGVRWRRHCYLEAVALEPVGAYRTAQVIAFRAEVDEEARREAEAARDRDAKRIKDDDAKKRRQDEIDEALDRKKRFAVLMGRYDNDMIRQRELMAHYGIKPGPGGPRGRAFWANQGK